MNGNAGFHGRTLRVALADDAEVLRRGLADLLSELPGVEVVGEAADAQQTIALVREQQPDALVLDFRMPGGGGLAVLEALKTAPRPPVVIVLTNYPEPAYRASCLAAGADYFLDKSTEFDQVARIIKTLQAGDAPARPPQPVGRPKRVLVTDDSATMRRMVMATLQTLPNVVFDQAGSGLEAIERLALAHTDLMVLDLNMPDMHGFEVLRFVRSHQAYQNLPIIVLTTRGDDASRAEALAAGASAYLTKPFQPAALAQCARQLLG